MHIHFTGQGRDVIINMNKVKETDCNLVMRNSEDSEPIVWIIRLVMQYPQGKVQTDEGTKPSIGMFHFDFRFNSEEEKNDCRELIKRALAGDNIYAIQLPDFITP